ncbi:NAD(P)/FAD-dependent oxidoreductase [Nitrosomonas sp. Is37]|uniref:NAD(P)/FAD-dependent oxidoreductase n=1 Tax=Nitrosomonas sp. Is37 TaxID=3080535 RepID=UPI00294AE7D8|nr:NAD(P)/FAD-dependent oxidoreductase [Nitrosomonas sp. Is37]MDV6345374.1 NAD(P)/FAD-dependent oxidoreductase [Nitrosomonas sp. Is37]
MFHSYDVIIIGAGAAGLMCAIQAGKRGRRVWLIDHMAKIAEKIRISGGGRCNFTNIHAHPQCYLSQNPHFCKSALKQYTAQDFIALVRRHGIAFHEKKLGQLFCDDSAKQIINMLLTEAREAGVKLEIPTRVLDIETIQAGYQIKTSKGDHTCSSLVIATGGLSIPKIGASNFGYETAKKFGLNVIRPRAGLVPLTFDGALLECCKMLSGLSVEAEVCYKKQVFAEGLLFTHRGLSGPSILQISSYWQEGEQIIVNLAPATDIFRFLKEKKQSQPKLHVSNALSEILPRRLAQSICDEQTCNWALGSLSDNKLAVLARAVNDWHIRPTGTEGYRTAEVTVGGVDTQELSSQTMEAKKRPGLFFIGEVVDVTGHLGGFNFQWAWSSGYAAGLAV